MIQILEHGHKQWQQLGLRFMNIALDSCCRLEHFEPDKTRSGYLADSVLTLGFDHWGVSRMRVHSEGVQYSRFLLRLFTHPLKLRPMKTPRWK